MNSVPHSKHNSSAFTLIELLIVIVIIAILAAISIVSYNGMQKKATEATLMSDLKNASTELEREYSKTMRFPGTDNETTDGSSLPKSDITTYQYTRSNNGQSYCLTATTTKHNASAFMISSDDTTPREGVCDGHSSTTGDDDGEETPTTPTAVTMQTITSSNCPSTRTLVYDARDNHTYWVQKLSDGNCWMLTNLAYGGGGTNTYGDTIDISSGGLGGTIADGTSDNAEVYYTKAKYYIPTGSNPTTNPTTPSVNTTGTGQYGYLYNWCAAMGSQSGTDACLSATSPSADSNKSICPASWWLPFGYGGDFYTLNTAVNGGLTYQDNGLLGDPWLGQRAGRWNGEFQGQGIYGYYWSSRSRDSTNAYSMYFGAPIVDTMMFEYKNHALAVRCIAK